MRVHAQTDAQAQHQHQHPRLRRASHRSRHRDLVRRLRLRHHDNHAARAGARQVGMRHSDVLC
jgi:hypothetical protein